GKGGMGKKGMATREEDYVNPVFTASTHDYILFFTDKGRVFRKKGYEIPEAGRTARGTNIVNVLQVEQDEKVAVMIHTRDISEGENPRYLTMFTRKGTVKRLDASALKNLRNNGLRVILLDEGDELIEVRETDGSQNVLIATHGGMAVVFPEEKIRPTGRNSMGVIGIRLREGDYVVAAARAKPGRAVLTITENGYGKRSPVEDYRITDRGAQGIKNYGLTNKTGYVVGVKVVDGSEDLLLVTQSGTLIRTDVDEIRTCGRASQGVIVMRFKEEGDRVIAMSLAEKEPGEGTETETASPETADE
ncbi:MAG: DNA gyrase subunit A, partial [Oscillospiraceae bacterium]|nr:DNA gyrase subunit A [Oscillospiraceae bacterium]